MMATHRKDRTPPMDKPGTPLIKAVCECDKPIRERDSRDQDNRCVKCGRKMK